MSFQRLDLEVQLGLAVRSGALELCWREEKSRFRLQLRFVSRVRPGGRVWTPGSLYKYVEERSKEISCKT